MVKKAHDREAHGDYEGAYNDLAEGLRASPKNKDLLEQKTRISELYAQDLLRRAACLPTNNLVTRIELLQSAAQLECGNHDEIAIALGNLMDERTAIHKRADVVVTSTNLVEMVTVVETMSDYINFDPRLRKKLIDNPDVIAHVENLFTQLTGNDLRDTRKLALRCGEIWRSEGIRQIRERTDARLRYLGVKALAPPAFADTSLGSEAVSFLVAALLAPSSNESIEAYRAASKQLKEAFLPIAKVHVQGALSAEQRDALLSAILRFGADTNLPIVSSSDTNIPELTVVVDVTDAAHKLRGESRVVYSKYFAGNTQVPNPAYAEAQRAYMYAQALEQQQATRYQQQLQRYAIDCQNNPYALAPVRPNDWGSILALGRLNRTAAYVEEPVYQDYQLKQNDLVTECRFQAEIRFGNSISGSNLFRVPMEGNQQFRFTETSEVRPNDVKGHANERAPANWAEDCLEKFVNSRLGETPSKVADLYCETVLARALDAIRRGEEQVGVEMALAWAMNSEKCRAVGRGQVSDWFAATEMHDLQNRFDNACFGAGGASLDGLWTNMVRGVMFQLGRVITPRSQAVGEAVSGADPMALRRSQTVLTRPTHDMSNRFLSVGAKSPTARMHATPSIAAVLRVTVTVFTDRGSGSGFVVSTNGFVVSNYHVIEGAKRVLIAGYDGKKTLAEVVDFNASRDLAILKVTEGSWTAAQLGDVDGIGVGDTVYAIGSPGGSEGAVLDQTVTRGIISGIRDFPSEANSNIKIEYIQTDAAINAGNSGGPLVNEAGKVVGVNTQKLVGRGVEGLNFSMSINEVKKLFFRYLND